MIKVVRGLIDNTYLLRLLDMAKNATKYDKIEEDEDISNEDSQIDAQRIALNQVEIENLYVSLMIKRDTIVLICCCYVNSKLVKLRQSSLSYTYFLDLMEQIFYCRK